MSLTRVRSGAHHNGTPGGDPRGPEPRSSGRKGTGGLKMMAQRAAFGWLVVALAFGLPGCTLWDRPSNFRPWSPDQALLPYAEIGDRLVHVYNIRDCLYLSADSYIVRHYDRVYDLDRLESVDFLVVPFPGLPAVAHTMLSFGFSGGEHLCLSIEIRREWDEQYQFVQGILNRYELMYVLGDERDLIKLRTNYRNDEVYLYPLRTTPDQTKTIFLDVLRRANDLAARPEFYHTFTNNCTTNLYAHLNRGLGGGVPYGLGVVLPGYSDRLLYAAGLISSSVPFDELRRRAAVRSAALQWADAEDFSLRIRR